MRISRQCAATDGFGPVQNLMQDAAFVAKGGERTFAGISTKVGYAAQSGLCKVWVVSRQRTFVQGPAKAG